MRRADSLVRSHAAMLRFLITACETSDALVDKGMKRGPKYQKQYEQARRLIEQAIDATKERQQ